MTQCAFCDKEAMAGQAVCPTHREIDIIGSLDDPDIMGKLDLFINDDNGNMDRNRPYEGQSWTNSGERGKQEISGITMRDLRDCFIRGAMLCSNDLHPHLYDEAMKGEKANLSAQDMYGWDLDKLDPMAWMNNMACEVERMMGIFPNIPPEDQTE